MIKHLACQMDGNRRWAQQRGWETFFGHRKGAEIITPVVQFCLDKNIPFLSLYAFSIENFKRSEAEKSFLFGMVAQELESRIEEFVTNGIRIRFIGDRTLFPPATISIIEQVEQETAQCTRLNLNFLFCYGAQQEIAYAARAIAHKVKIGELSESSITPEVVAQHLWTSGIPEPDLIIRPGGRNRLSNFLLFQSAYSEYFFLDCLWPDVNTQLLEEILSQFESRKRNFGQ